MPLPTPKDGEGKDSFIKRCLHSGNIKKEFDSIEQRLAVCHQKWRDKHGGSKPK